MVARLKPIIPPNKTFNAAAFDAAVNEAIRKTLETGKNLFERTTKNFQNTKVVFYIIKLQEDMGAVGTDHPIYMYITRGTRPHLITPVRAKFLVFGEGKYKSVTQPGVLGSRRVGTGLQGKGGVARPIFTKLVHHPGTKPRNFEQEVAKRLQPIHTVNMQKAMLKGLTK